MAPGLREVARAEEARAVATPRASDWAPARDRSSAWDRSDSPNGTRNPTTSMTVRATNTQASLWRMVSLRASGVRGLKAHPDPDYRVEVAGLRRGRLAHLATQVRQVDVDGAALGAGRALHTAAWISSLETTVPWRAAK